MRSETVHDSDTRSDDPAVESGPGDHRDPLAGGDPVTVDGDRPDVVDGEAVSYDAEPDTHHPDTHDPDAHNPDTHDPDTYDGDPATRDANLDSEPGSNDADPVAGDLGSGSYDAEPVAHDPAAYDAEPVAATAPVAGATDPAGPQGGYAAAADRADSGSSWPADTVADLQDRWRDIQLRFVDDPRNAAGEAQDLLDRALSEYSRVMAARKSELDGWRDGDAGQSDTEQMRLVLRRYRDMLDQLLAH